MTEQQALQLQNALEQNAKIVEQFIEEKELVADWQSYLAELQKEQEDCRSRVKHRGSICTRTSRR